MYIELRNINKYYGSYHASQNINLGITKGNLVALLGPSGSGKTTILRMIAGLEQPDSGELWINGKLVNDLTPAQRGIGFVFQNYALFRYMTVEENIAFGLTLQKKAAKEIKAKVEELLNLIGLADFGKRYPNQLSGGQKQRVAFARALAPNPDVLLLDEPFAALDVKVKEELRASLKHMIQQVGITSIFVTHDQSEAVELADEIIVTNGGKIEQQGSPREIYQHPATPFVAKFIGTSNVIENYGALNGFQQVATAKKAIIRPEFLQIAKHGTLEKYSVSAEKAIVRDIVFRGNNLAVELDLKGMVLYGEYSLDAPGITVGEMVDVVVYRLYLLEEDSTYLVENSALNNRNNYYI